MEFQPSQRILLTVYIRKKNFNVNNTLPINTLQNLLKLLHTLYTCSVHFPKLKNFKLFLDLFYFVYTVLLACMYVYFTHSVSAKARREC